MVISELSPEYIIQPKNTKDKRVSRSPNTQDRQTHTGTILLIYISYKITYNTKNYLQVDRIYIQNCN